MIEENELNNVLYAEDTNLHVSANNTETSRKLR